MRDYRPQSEKSRTEKLLQAFAQTRLGGKLFISVFPEIDRRLMPVTRGRLSTGLGQPVALLHVRGAKSGVERERLWAMAVDNYNGYDRYQQRAGARTIPVVALRPR